MIPIKASAWLNKLDDSQREALRVSGMFPVVDVFWDLWEDLDSLAASSRIKLLYGGYGSGKSVDRCTKALKMAAEGDYFRCYFGRKVLDDVRGSLHATFCDIIEDNGWQSRFKYSREPNGSMVIRHTNGNQFIPFGASNISGLKSIKDPTLIICDELDQYAETDIAMLLSRLRTIKRKTELWGMFNSAAVMPNDWIIRWFFPERLPADQGDIAAEIKEILEAVGVHKLFCNFPDNPFINHEEYLNTLRLTANGDGMLLRAMAYGDFGVQRTGQEFYKCFSSEKHIGDCPYNPDLPLHMSWDDNVNPYLPAGIFQLSGNSLVMIDEIAGVTPKNTVDAVCVEFKKRYGKHRGGLFVYGDATARKADTKLEKGHNFYTLIADKLADMRPVLRVSRANPSVVMRGNFINGVLDKNLFGLSFKIDRKCGNTINDFMRTQEASDGTKHKAVVKDQKTKIRYQQYGHFTDLTDYIMCCVWENSYKRFTARKGMGIRKIAGLLR